MNHEKGQLTGKKHRVDYTAYRHLHIEDSPRKIEEILTVIPTGFRGPNLLDVGCDAGVITRNIARSINANTVHAVEPSRHALPYAQQSLQEFPSHKIHQGDFSEYKPEDIFDITMFIDVLEHVKNPAELLKNASRFSRFAVIRTPLEDSIAVQIHQQLYGEDIQALMEERYGHIHHFNRKAVRDMVNQGGFDIIHENITRIPQQASILTPSFNRAAESATWNLARNVYPELWGGFYLAFLKSRNVEVIEQKTANAIHQELVEEFGEDNIISVGVFGSTARYTDKKHSDYDYTIIVKDLPSDINEREHVSPRLKKKLRERGIDELCAFNLYTQEEFKQANAQRSWLIESMKVGYRVFYNKNGFLEGILSAQQPDVERVGNLAWRGVDYEDGSHLRGVIERHLKVAGLIEDVDPELADYHRKEAQRGELISRLYRWGEYDTRSSIFSLAKRLNHQYGEKVDLTAAQMDDYQQEVEGKDALYGYNSVERHLKVAQVLETNQMPLDALFHTYSALRNIYLYALHSQNQYIVDGEITQLFLRDFAGQLPPELVEKIYANSFKAEQILGRSGFVSFDLDRNGKPLYEDPDTSQFNYPELNANIRQIISELRFPNGITSVQEDQNKTIISIVVATYNRPQKLQSCIQGLNRLIIPEGKADLIIVDDGSTQDYDINQLERASKLPVRYVKKEHSGICATKNRGIEESKGYYIAFLDDDMIVSPLWLIQLLSGFKNDRIAGVGSTNLTYPDTNYLTRYSDYRELARKPFQDKIGEVVNVLTGSACLRKDVLEEVGGFNVRQSKSGVPFGGDDVDLTWRVRNAGYLLKHVEGAIAFHNHRSNFKALVKQHIGYGEGTMFHCIDSGRNPEELGIPNPTYTAVAGDIFHYVTREVPKRAIEVYRNHMGIRNAVQYPLLDLTRRTSYNLGTLKARKFKKRNLENIEA